MKALVGCRVRGGAEEEGGGGGWGEEEVCGACLGVICVLECGVALVFYSTINGF